MKWLNRVIGKSKESVSKESVSKESVSKESVSKESKIIDVPNSTVLSALQLDDFIKSSSILDETPLKYAERSFQALPWKHNGQYLENHNKDTMAICANDEIAKSLAACVEYYSSLHAFEDSKTKAYGKFIQDAYYLYIAMSNARIPVNSVETIFVEKAFHQFCLSLNEIIQRENLKFEVISDDTISKINPEKNIEV